MGVDEVRNAVVVIVAGSFFAVGPSVSIAVVIEVVGDAISVDVEIPFFEGRDAIVVVVVVEEIEHPISIRIHESLITVEHTIVVRIGCVHQSVALLLGETEGVAEQQLLFAVQPISVIELPLDRIMGIED